MFLAALTLLAHAGASNDWTGPVSMPKNTTAVHVESVEGDVRFKVDPAATEVTAEAVDFRPGRACTLEVTKDKKGRATIWFGPKDQEDPKKCRADFTISLPPTMDARATVGLGAVKATGLGGALELTVGTGSVELTDQQGAATVTLGTGDLTLERVSGDLTADLGSGKLLGTEAGKITARVGTGKIKLTGLTGPIQADTGVGDILLEYRQAPSGDLRVNAGTGNVVIDLPSGTKVRPRLSSMNGSTTCELPEGGEIEVVAVAGIGSVRLH